MPFDPDALDRRDVRTIQALLPLFELFAEKYVRLRRDGLEHVPAGPALWLNPGTGVRKTKPVDWLGLCLLAVFMVTLISGLHALPAARSAPQAAIVPLVLRRSHWPH